MEDPFVYPIMSCPLCGFRFMFKEPFHEADRFICPECKQHCDIPDQIIEQFIENIEFKQYLDRHKSPGGGAINSQPPIV